MEISTITKRTQVYSVLDADWETPIGENNLFGADSDGFSKGRIQVPAGVDIVIDLNGHNIDCRLTTYTQHSSVMCSYGGGKFTENGCLITNNEQAD